MGRNNELVKPLFALMLCGAALVGSAPGRAQPGDFPFDSEVILDVDPMRGSRRIPNMDIMPDGAIALEMWCNRVEGRLLVSGDSITVMTGLPTERPCPPERVAGDEELLAALAGVTSWQRNGNILLLVGPRTLRFRLPTN
jgi:heat shock protein HslJ